MPMVHKVVFLPSGTEAQAEDGELLSDVAKRAGVRIPMPCGGAGRCGRCKVIADGEEVLACRHHVVCDTTVSVPERDRGVVVAADRGGQTDDDISPLCGGYALAVDIGTTTIALSVMDSSTGEEVYAAAGVNGQRAVGDDVLSRIQYASEGGTEDMRRMVIDSINGLMDGAPEGIQSVYIAGNTTMEHLFLGIDPTPIRAPPYLPVEERREITGEESGLRVDPGARVLTMPCVSAYVGGDIASDIVCSGMDRSEGMCLLIDVGTNGEVALGNCDLMVVCSSSAGPAFEGGNLKSGMIAGKGAIDSVRIIGDTIRYTVIGGGEPAGICGSGILAVVKELLRTGLVKKTGAFIKKDRLSPEDYRFPLLQLNGTKREFILHEKPQILVTQGDVRQVQLAKGAILSGVTALLREAQIDMEDLDKVMIAGQFGAHLPADSLIGTGILPDAVKDKLVYVGNSSKTGAYMALMSKKAKQEMEKLAEEMEYMELAETENYERIFTDSMIFPTF